MLNNLRPTITTTATITASNGLLQSKVEDLIDATSSSGSVSATNANHSNNSSSNETISEVKINLETQYDRVTDLKQSPNEKSSVTLNTIIDANENDGCEDEDEDEEHGRNSDASGRYEVIKTSTKINENVTSIVITEKLVAAKLAEQEEVEEKEEIFNEEIINDHIKSSSRLCSFKFNFRIEFKKQCTENLLLLMTILAVIVGVLIGFLLRENFDLKPPVKAYIGFPGEIFLRLLRFLILPLMGSSLISGIAGLSKSKTSQIASRAFLYYFSTTFLAAVLGLVLVLAINPGKRASIDTKILTSNDTINGRKMNPLDTMFDLMRNLFPENLVQMTFMQYESKLVPKYKLVELIESPNKSVDADNNSSKLSANNVSRNRTFERVFDYWQALPSDRNGLNVLGLVMFCLTFGCVISSMKENGLVLLKFFEAINEASIRMINILMLFSPIGICSLICVTILNMDNPTALFERIGFYTLTVLVGLAIHGFLVLPLIYIVITRRNIFKFAKNMLEALAVALATSSSNATLPVTFKCIEEKNKIPKMISRFVLPVGATINMDGTALYEAIAAIFIAQLNNLDLRFVDYVITSLTATVASIGAAGVPSAGLVTMVIVLSALNLPASQISLIYAVDWFLDRFRTIMNVWGDAIGAGVVAHLCANNHDDEEEQDENAKMDNNLNEIFSFDKLEKIQPTMTSAITSTVMKNGYSTTKIHHHTNNNYYHNQNQQSKAVVRINESYIDDPKNGETSF